jgi:hypothetical protein
VSETASGTRHFLRAIYPEGLMQTGRTGSGRSSEEERRARCGGLAHASAGHPLIARTSAAAIGLSLPANQQLRLEGLLGNDIGQKANRTSAVAL